MFADVPAGQVAARPGGEPVSALYTTTEVPLGLLGSVAVSASGQLVRRGSDRADHLPLSQVEASRVLGFDAVTRLVETICHANSRWWRLEVDSFEFKVLRYRPGHYHPEHVDMFPGSMRRKLTMVVQLSDPSHYVGGDLEVAVAGPHWAAIPRQAGLAAVFPAWTRHRVTRVERGERCSLAAWGYGPPIR